MLNYSIIIIALSLAFFQIEVIRFGAVKPFNCMKCMTGWYALGLGCWLYGWHGLVYLPVGLFAGAIFSAIKMRWL